MFNTFIYINDRKWSLTTQGHITHIHGHFLDSSIHIYTGKNSAASPVRHSVDSGHWVFFSIGKMESRHNFCIR